MAISLMDIRDRSFLKPASLLLFLSVSLCSYQLIHTSDVQSVQSYMDILEGSPFQEIPMPQDQISDNNEEDNPQELERDPEEFVDALATSGRLFSYKLPAEFLGDNVFNFKVNTVYMSFFKVF